MAPGGPRHRYAISDSAYLTVVLHAAKHPGPVHGLLLGRESDGPVSIVDALPVAHSAFAGTTAPTTDMALLLARAHAATRGLVVAGAYYAPELADDLDVPVLPTRLADLIRAQCGFACLLVLDATRLHPDRRRTEHCLRLCTMDGGVKTASWGKGKWDAEFVEVSKGVLQLCDESLKSSPGSAQGVVDFEEHCLDPALDWLNCSAGLAV